LTLSVFLDGDIKNLTPEWIDLLSEPVLSGGYDMARGYYDRHPRDAVLTKLVAKPVLSIFFPELMNVEHPQGRGTCKYKNMEGFTQQHRDSTGWLAY
jgi:hypothetical protein